MFRILNSVFALIFRKSTAMESKSFYVFLIGVIRPFGTSSLFLDLAPFSFIMALFSAWVWMFRILNSVFALIFRKSTAMESKTFYVFLKGDISPFGTTSQIFESFPYYLHINSFLLNPESWILNPESWILNPELTSTTWWHLSRDFPSRCQSTHIFYKIYFSIRASDYS